MTDPGTATGQPSTDPTVVAYEALLALLRHHDGDDRCGHLGEALADSLLADDHEQAVVVALSTLAHCELNCEAGMWGKGPRADEEQGRTEGKILGCPVRPPQSHAQRRTPALKGRTLPCTCRTV